MQISHLSVSSLQRRLLLFYCGNDGTRSVYDLYNLWEVTRAIVENMWVDSVSKHMPKSEDFKKNILDREEI